ncbi:hypothetical protein RND81_03G025400 [Saponaria officinalis]|uniref:SWIM-type domain-containing protein n=1 Tax=Saponaria officinalis TaxID=3572 RepID=A0AAW1M2T3_SAPOF
MGTKHTPPILLSYSPKGSQQWIRKVEEEFTPRIGMEFNTLEDGMHFYRIYAIACGFDVRKSSQRRFRDQTIRTKCIVRHREGFGESKKMKTLVNMETAETRFGCTTIIKLVFKSGKYVIGQFREGHNHPLLLVKNHEFQKLSRNLTLYHKICMEVANGYQNVVGASLLDFKNFRREVKLFIGDKDAEMFISNLEKLVHSKKGFQYVYHMLMGKSAYLTFGDGVSFDPTYGTNKYYMVFQNFIEETDFMSRLNGVVWNQDLEPLEFEDKWNEVINEFGLEDNRWLSTMFDIKEYWIPAYSREMHMGNIMSTTQRSESENSFFKKFENHYGTLRHAYKRLEMESNNSIPKTITPLSLKSHALTVYTNVVFYEIQEEIKSSMCGCGIVGYTRTAPLEVTTIEDSDNRILVRKKKFSVQYNALTSDVRCICKLFERRGLICRHNCWVFSNKLMKTIPEKYILQRWSKNALRGPIYDLNRNVIENYNLADESQLEMSNVWSDFYYVISMVAKKEADVLKNLQRILKEFKDKVEPTNDKMSKQQEMEMLIGGSAPNEVRILPPRQSKNKGSGKRMLTSKNKAIEKAKKPKRRCGNYKQMVYHDNRNCQEPFSKHPPEEEENCDSERVDQQSFSS